MTTEHDAQGPGTHRKITIDLDQARKFELPRTNGSLKPQRIAVSDGRGGWALGLKEQRPLATPAYADGRVYLGGGYGAYSFYAFDAATGEMIWTVRTADDGPTAAVVEDGFVVFATESCTLMVLEAETGRLVWEEWLGDPLMSQPAVSCGRVFMAYPADQPLPVIRKGMSLEEKQEAIGKAKAQRSGYRMHHRMLCADLRTGKHLWEQEITADVISAPVVDGEQVFMTCIDGTSYCLRASDGEIVWKKENAGTSSPLVVEGRVITTEKEVAGAEIYQRLRRSQRHSGRYQESGRAYRSKSDYLRAMKGGGSSLKSAAAQELDSLVGFSSPPSSAKLHMMAEHIGVSSVSGAWAYQGARSAYAKGRVYSSPGKHVACFNESDESLAWEAEVKGGHVDLDDQIFSPPALGRDHLYLTSVWGHLVSVHQETGEPVLLYSTDRSIPFQPCLANGRIYWGTTEGELVCLETGDDDADGWYMWGGNAQHNKTR